MVGEPVTGPADASARSAAAPSALASARAPQATGSLPPLVEPGPELSPDQLARFARHLVLPGIGAEGQRRLAAARVLLIGAGGLGSPALLYLAAAGVGTLGIVDDDAVDASNLQRQVAHSAADVGRPKTTSARETAEALSPGVTVVEHRVRLTSSNALEVLRGYDLVLDGSDNFATRYLVSDAAEILGMPVVWGGLHQFQGQVSVFWGRPAAGEGVTYRDVFPSPPPPELAPDCATGGVLGALCGSLGSAMATEAIKLITGTGRTLLGRLAIHDALEGSWRYLTVRRDPSRSPVTELPDDDAYLTFCGVRRPGADAASVTVEDLARLRSGAEEPPFVLDVREPWELEIAALDGTLNISSTTLLTGDERALVQVRTAAAGRRVYVLCKSGARSARVATLLREKGLDARDVAGGINAWSERIDATVPTY